MPDARATRTREARQRAPVDAARRHQREPSKRRPPAHLQPMVELYGELLGEKPHEPGAPVFAHEEALKRPTHEAAKHKPEQRHRFSPPDQRAATVADRKN